MRYGVRVDRYGLPMQKFLICKTGLSLCAAFLLVGCGETIKTAVKKSDEFIYEHADESSRKDEVTGKRVQPDLC